MKLLELGTKLELNVPLKLSLTTLNFSFNGSLNISFLVSFELMQERGTLYKLFSFEKWTGKAYIFACPLLKREWGTINNNRKQFWNSCCCFFRHCLINFLKCPCSTVKNFLKLGFLYEWCNNIMMNNAMQFYNYYVNCNESNSRKLGRMDYALFASWTLYSIVEQLKCDVRDKGLFSIFSLERIILHDQIQPGP